MVANVSNPPIPYIQPGGVKKAGTAGADDRGFAVAQDLSSQRTNGDATKQSPSKTMIDTLDGRQAFYDVDQNGVEVVHKLPLTHGERLAAISKEHTAVGMTRTAPSAGTETAAGRLLDKAI